MGKKEKLDEIRKRMNEDKSLPLRSGATQLVFGDGNPETDILCVGEGPGYFEDQKGLPFVGNAGKLLDQLLEGAGMTRKNDVYITNVVHHRPPENRDPHPQEIASYGVYLDEIIETIDPEVIITLGRFSMNKFLPSAKISRIHGQEQVCSFKGREVIVVPMYHPAAALRSSEVMLQEREDFANLPNILAKIRNKKDASDEQKSVGEQLQLV